LQPHRQSAPGQSVQGQEGVEGTFIGNLLVIGPGGSVQRILFTSLGFDLNEAANLGRIAPRLDVLEQNRIH
jgi:hypothetical protein